jgi:hypothetical protein
MKNMRTSKSWLSIPNLIFVIAGGILLISFIVSLIQHPWMLSPIGLPSPMVTYTGTTVPFTLKHPESWQVVETVEGAGLHADNYVIAFVYQAVPGLFIARKEIDPSNFQSAYQWGKDRTASCEGYTFISEEPYLTPENTYLKHNYACTRIISPFTGTKEAVPCSDFYTVFGDYAYVLTFCAREKDLSQVTPVFEEMINSFSVEAEK